MHAAVWGSLYRKAVPKQRRDRLRVHLCRCETTLRVLQHLEQVFLNELKDKILQQHTSVNIAFCFDTAAPAAGSTCLQ